MDDYCLVVQHSPLHDRLRAIAGEHSYRRIGELTETHPETVRRYMQGQAPSAEFLTRVCEVFGVSGQWLLTGRGAMRASEIRTRALREAEVTELLGALVDGVGDLLQRLERTEVSMRHLEARVCAASGNTAGPKASGATPGAKPPARYADQAPPRAGGTLNEEIHGSASPSPEFRRRARPLRDPHS